MATNPWDDYAAPTPAPAPDPNAQADPQNTIVVTAPRLGVDTPVTTNPSADGANDGGATVPWGDYVTDQQSPLPSAGQPQQDELLGFGREVARPLENLSLWTENGLQKIGIPAAQIDHALGAPSAQDMINNSDQIVANAAKQGRVPGAVGSVLGNFVGTSPALAIPGIDGMPFLQPILQGGAMGALSTKNPNNGGSVAVGAGLGGVGGLAGKYATDFALNSLAPTISKGVQTLQGAGVGDALSPGQVAGKNSIWGISEGLGQAVPFTGEMIRKQGNDSLIAANRGAFNTVAQKFGSTVPVIGDTPADLMSSLQAIKNNAYNVQTAAGGMTLDPTYNNTVGAITGNINKIPTSTGLPGKFQDLVDQEIGARVDPQTGMISDQGVMDAKAAVNQEINNWSSDPSGWSRQYVTGLTGLRNALTDNLRRADPGAADQLARADAAYPAYKILQNAVKRGTQNSTNDMGWFNPQNLQAAITAATPEARLTTGGGAMQDYASAMKEVLPRKFKDVASGWHTAAEAIVPLGVGGSEVFGIHGAGLPAAATILGSIPLASPYGQAAIRTGLNAAAGGRSVLESILGQPLTNITSYPATYAGAQGANQVFGLFGGGSPRQ